MIYISYGVPKSASTFLYQLTEEILRFAGYELASLSKGVKGQNSPENYVDPINGAALDAIQAEIMHRSVVIKTHGAPDRRIFDAMQENEVFANAIIRDPREIALALVDHGQRSRNAGIRDFSEFYKPTDTISLINDQIKRFNHWSLSRNLLRITYDELCFDSLLVVDKIARQLDVVIDGTAVLGRFANRSVIRHFNKGVRGRYLELSSEDNEIFISTFSSFYRDGRFFVPSR